MVCEIASGVHRRFSDILDGKSSVRCVLFNCALRVERMSPTLNSLPYEEKAAHSSIVTG